MLLFYSFSLLFTTPRPLLCTQSLLRIVKCNPGHWFIMMQHMDRTDMPKPYDGDVEQFVQTDLAPQVVITSLDIVSTGDRTTKPALVHPVRPDQHPAAVYIARLAPGSRRTMTAALDTIAGVT